MNKGFTLIEVMVAVGIFAIIISVFAGFFVNIILTQRQALHTQQLIDNVSYNLEYISRSIRMAKKQLDDPPPCLSNRGDNYEITANSLKFIKFDHSADPPRDVCLEFSLENGRLWQRKDGGQQTALTPAKFTVDSFEVSGEETWEQGQDPQKQPKVEIDLEIEGLKIRTIISQRDLNIIY